MKFYYIFNIILLVSFGFYSCTQNNIENSKTTYEPIIKSNSIIVDSVEIPKFEIQVQLSDSAERVLSSSNESIIVSAFFDGEPKDSVNTELLDEFGQIILGSSQIELIDSRRAIFENIKIPSNLFSLLKNDNYEVLISVVTGRKSSEYNLIDCEFIQKPISEVKNKVIILNGRLIGEKGI